MDTDKFLGREEAEVLSACALRFDGYKYCSDINMDTSRFGPGSLAEAFRDFMLKPDYSATQDYLCMIMFFIQRTMLREGWIREGDHELGVARSIFLKTCSKAISEKYLLDTYHDEWLHRYQPNLPYWIDVVKSKHLNSKYRTFVDHSDPE